MITSTKNKIFFLEKKYDLRIKFFISGIFLIYLDGYTILSVPCPWIGLMFCTCSSISNKIMPFQKLFWSMIFLIPLLATITFIQYENNSAPLNFIILRFINLLSLIIIVNFIAIQKFRSDYILKLENNLIILGLFFSIIAIISFFFQVFDFQQINIIDNLKNRISTGGGSSIRGVKDGCLFGDAYAKLCHRAQGTFREPSLLSISLILPLFLSIKNKNNFAILIIGLSIYFSYSLAVFIGIIFGTTFSLLILYKSKLFSVKNLLIFLIVIFVIYFLYIYDVLSSNIYAERIISLIENKSRSYIFNNLEIILGNYWTGNGVGYSYFSLSEQIFKDSEHIFDKNGNVVPTSFLSLPLNFLSAGGIVCLAIVFLWVIYPNISSFIYFDQFNRNLYLMLCMINIYLLLYFTSVEELHIWHAISLGICLNFLSFNKRKID